MAAQVLVEILIYQTMFRQSELFVEVLIVLQKNVSNKSDRKRKRARATGASDNRKNGTDTSKMF